MDFKIQAGFAGGWIARARSLPPMRGNSQEHLPSALCKKVVAASMGPADAAALIGIADAQESRLWGGLS
ncbi:hypothetical protein [Acidovorax sp. NCPPB 3576]|uniref:hypothetical protein n=1 Tax=Acidovorax sp. NCPPB 3576 TaxID=2940488 RepID=UPI00234A6169|nr:hypothetical protein [Acidovorax sp. NCPPB 3576]WCM90559.1 hypothetical protein M5C98_11305 [Acidovorax sp. NCPPB 3576]